VKVRRLVSIAAGAILIPAFVVAAQDLNGAGSSFAAPLYARWSADYAAKTGVKVNYQSVGSGAGIK
jgi:phosphate transport system substrate-binding protein